MAESSAARPNPIWPTTALVLGIALFLGTIVLPVVLPGCFFAFGAGERIYDNRIKRIGAFIAAYVAIAAIVLGLVGL
jgi:hypothetical protein